MRRLLVFWLFLFLMQVLPAQTDEVQTAVPRLQEIYAVLERVRGPLLGLPIFPSNRIPYYHAAYQMGESPTQEESREIRIYAFEDQGEFVLRHTQERPLCSGRVLRFAEFDSRFLAALQVPELGGWIVFSFPDRDLGICEFIEDFLDLYLFFRSASPEATVPPFPGVVGSFGP